MKSFFLLNYLLAILLLFSCKTTSSLQDPLSAGWNGEKVCEKIEENKMQRILKCTFKPGVGHERHNHLPHFGYTLAGSTFKIKDTSCVRVVNVKTGSYFNNESIEWHEVINIGDSTVVFLIIEPK